MQGVKAEALHVKIGQVPNAVAFLLLVESWALETVWKAGVLSGDSSERQSSRRGSQNSPDGDMPYHWQVHPHKPCARRDWLNRGGRNTVWGSGGVREKVGLGQHGISKWSWLDGEVREGNKCDFNLKSQVLCALCSPYPVEGELWGWVSSLSVIPSLFLQRHVQDRPYLSTWNETPAPKDLSVSGSCSHQMPVGILYSIFQRQRWLASGIREQLGPTSRTAVTREGLTKHNWTSP